MSLSLDSHIPLKRHGCSKAIHTFVVALVTLTLSLGPSPFSFAQENQVSIGCVATPLESIPLLIVEQEHRALANGVSLKFQAYKSEAELVAALTARTVDIGQMTMTYALELAAKDPQFVLM